MKSTMVVVAFVLAFAKTSAPQTTPTQLSAPEKQQATKGWVTASPASVGVDEQVLLRLDKDIASGKYSQMSHRFCRRHLW